MFPDAVHQQNAWLNKKDYDFVYKYMSMLPKKPLSQIITANIGTVTLEVFMFRDNKKNQCLAENIRIFQQSGRYLRLFDW
jgi:hypothetical protein